MQQKSACFQSFLKAGAFFYLIYDTARHHHIDSCLPVKPGFTCGYAGICYRNSGGCDSPKLVTRERQNERGRENAAEEETQSEKAGDVCAGAQTS
jgi:hypothetical protein